MVDIKINQYEKYLAGKYAQEKFDDTTGVIRNRKYKDSKYNGQKNKDQRTSYDLLNTAQKTEA